MVRFGGTRRHLHLRPAWFTAPWPPLGTPQSYVIAIVAHTRNEVKWLFSQGFSFQAPPDFRGVLARAGPDN